MTLEEVVKAAKSGLRFAVESYPGIAFYFHSREVSIEFYEDGCYDETGFANMVMVGDDRIHVIDPDEISTIRDDQYCSECGQIGCGHGVY